jgi:hypothetical protein
MTPAQYNEYQRQAEVIEQAKKWKEEQERKQMSSIEFIHNIAKRREPDKFDWDQAREMHKKEIIDAYYLGNYSDTRIAEKYYEKTFNKD